MADPGGNVLLITDNSIIQSSFVSKTVLDAAEASLNDKQATRDTLKNEFDAQSKKQNKFLSEITALNQEINVLTRALNTDRTKEKDLVKKEDLNTNERKEIKDLLETLPEGDSRVPVLEARLQALEIAHSQLKDEISDVRHNIKDTEERIAEASTTRDDKVKESNELAADIRRTSSSLALSETELLQATQLYNGKKEVFDFQQSQINSIASVNTSAENSLFTSIVDKGVTLSSQIDVRNQKLKDYESNKEDLEIKRRDCEITQLNFDIASNLPATFDTWEKRFDYDLKAFLKLIQIQIRNYKTQHEGEVPSGPPISEINEKYENFGSEIRSLYESWKDSFENYESLVNELKTLPSSIREIEANIERLGKLITEYKDLLKGKVKEKKELEDQIPSLENKKSQNEQIIRDATKFLEKVGSDIEKMGKELQVEEAGLLEDKGEKSKTEADIATLTTQISTLESAIATLETEITAIAESIDDKQDEEKGLKDRIKELHVKRDEGGGLTSEETSELATKEASVEQIKQDIEALEKSREQKTDQKKTFQTDLDKAKDDKSSADKELAEINDNISAREAAIAKIKDQIQNANSDAAVETKKKNDAESENKTIDKQITEAKSKLQLLEAEVESLEQKLVDSEEEKADNESELASMKDRLKELQEDDNAEIRKAEDRANKELDQLNQRKSEILSDELKDSTTRLEEDVNQKLSKIKEINELRNDINVMQSALILMEDAKALTDQTKDSISVMVDGQNMEEVEAVANLRSKSAQLKDEDGESINFTAQEANNQTLAEKHSMSVSGKYIKAQIKKDPGVKRVIIPSNVEIEPAEILTLIKYGYNVTFEKITLREGDTFTPALQLVIDWNSPNETDIEEYVGKS